MGGTFQRGERPYEFRARTSEEGESLLGGKILKRFANLHSRRLLHLSGTSVVFGSASLLTGEQTLIYSLQLRLSLNKPANGRSPRLSG